MHSPLPHDLPLKILAAFDPNFIRENFSSILLLLPITKLKMGETYKIPHLKFNQMFSQKGENKLTTATVSHSIAVGKTALVDYKYDAPYNFNLLGKIYCKEGMLKVNSGLIMAKKDGLTKPMLVKNAKVFLECFHTIKPFSLRDELVEKYTPFIDSLSKENKSAITDFYKANASASKLTSHRLSAGRSFFLALILYTSFAVFNNKEDKALINIFSNLNLYELDSESITRERNKDFPNLRQT